MSATNKNMTPGSRELLLDRLERITEIPLMLLSLIMIPLLLGPFLWDMSKIEERIFFLVDILIWGLFVIDMVVKTVLSPNRLKYLKDHWLELIVVAVPWFRPLRVVRLVVYAAKSYRGVTRAGKPDFLLVYAVALIMICATLVTTFEQGYGSVVAVFLMLGGLGIFGAITANLASIFSHSEDPNTALIADLAEQVRELKAEISSRRP